MNLLIARNGTKMWVRYICLSYLMRRHRYHQFVSSLRQLLCFCQVFCKCQFVMLLFGVMLMTSLEVQ